MVFLLVWLSGHPSSPRRPPRASRFRPLLVPRRAWFLIEPVTAPPVQLELSVFLRTKDLTVRLRLPQRQDQHLFTTARLL